MKRASKTISLDSLATMTGNTPIHHPNSYDSETPSSDFSEIGEHPQNALGTTSVLRPLNRNSSKSQTLLPGVGLQRKEGSMDKLFGHGWDGLFSVGKRLMSRRDKNRRGMANPVSKTLSLLIQSENSTSPQQIEQVSLTTTENLAEATKDSLSKYGLDVSRVRFYYHDTQTEVPADTPCSTLTGAIIFATSIAASDSASLTSMTIIHECKASDHQQKRNSVSGVSPETTSTPETGPSPTSPSSRLAQPSVQIRRRPLSHLSMSPSTQRPMSAMIPAGGSIPKPKANSNEGTPNSPRMTSRNYLDPVLEGPPVLSTTNISPSPPPNPSTTSSSSFPTIRAPESSSATLRQYSTGAIYSGRSNLPQRPASSLLQSSAAISRSTSSLATSVVSINSTTSSRHNSKLSHIWNPQKEKVEQLTERLGHLSRLFIDLEPMTGDILFVEPSWESVVGNAASLSPVAQKQQAAVWELLSTEAAFLQSLRTIQKVFLNTFQDVQPDFFPELQISRIFSNLDEVLEANKILWRRYLQPCLRVARLQSNPLRPSLLKQGFLLISDIFRPYTKFCMEMSACRRYIQNQERQNPCFSAFLQWGGGIQSTSRLSLCDQLVHPFQRLTKYKLLLERIREYSTNANEMIDLDEMIRAVSDFVRQVNEDIHRHELWEKLEAIDHRIEAYEAVELPGEEYANVLKRFSDFRLKSPMMLSFRHDAHSASMCPPQAPPIRHVLHQGSLRLKEGPNKSTEVYCYLFTDLMLITKPSKKSSTKQKISRPPIRLDRLHFRKINDTTFALIVLNDFQCASALYGMTADARLVTEWLDALKKARKTYLHMLRECNALCGSPSIPFADDYEAFGGDRHNRNDLLSPNVPEEESLDELASVFSGSTSLLPLVPRVQVIRSSPNFDDRTEHGNVASCHVVGDESTAEECLLQPVLRRPSQMNSAASGGDGPAHSSLLFYHHELSPPPQRPRSVTDLRCLTKSIPTEACSVTADTSPQQHYLEAPSPTDTTTTDIPAPILPLSDPSPVSDGGLPPRRSRSRTPRRQDPRFHTDPTPTASPNKSVNPGSSDDASIVHAQKPLGPAFSAVHTCSAHQENLEEDEHEEGNMHNYPPSTVPHRPSTAAVPHHHPLTQSAILHGTKEQRQSFDSSSGISSIGSAQARSESEISEIHASSVGVQVFVHRPVPSSTCGLEVPASCCLVMESAHIIGATGVIRPFELTLPISGSPTVSASNLSQHSALSQEGEDSTDDEELLNGVHTEETSHSAGTQTSPQPNSQHLVSNAASGLNKRNSHSLSDLIDMP